MFFNIYLRQKEIQILKRQFKILQLLHIMSLLFVSRMNQIQRTFSLKLLLTQLLGALCLHQGHSLIPVANLNHQREGRSQGPDKMTQLFNTIVTFLLNIRMKNCWKIVIFLLLQIQSQDVHGLQPGVQDHPHQQKMLEMFLQSPYQVRITILY